MAELTLKDESVLEIGKSVSQSFEGLAKTGKSLVVSPSGTSAVQANDFIGPKLPETNESEGVLYQTSLLEEISQGIQDLILSFTDMLSFNKKEAADQDIQERVREGQMTEIGKETPKNDTGDPKKGLLANAMNKLAAIKEGASNLLSKEGLLGLIIKGGLIAGLLILAKGLQKYGKQISEVVAPIVDGIKRFFGRLSQDFGPALTEAFDIISDTFTGLLDIVKGVFNLDGEQIMKGLDAITEIPKRIFTFLIEAAGSIINAIGAAFGIDGDVTTHVKNFLINLENSIKDTFTNAIQGIKDGFNNTIKSIKDTFMNAVSSIGGFFGSIGDKVKSMINSAIESLPLPGFVKKKLKLDTAASEAADNRITETGVKGKYADDSIVGMQRERMTGGGATMEEGFAEATGEKYGTARITQSGTSGYDSASGILTPQQMTELNSLKTNEEQLAYLKSLDEKEQERRSMIMKLKQDKIDHDKRLAKMIEEGKALQPEFGGEIISPDDQLMMDNQAYRNRARQLNEDSAAMTNRDQGKVNVITSKGATNNVNTANNTYTTILEDTNTSDRNIRNYLSA